MVILDWIIEYWLSPSECLTFFDLLYVASLKKTPPGDFFYSNFFNLCNSYGKYGSTTLCIRIKMANNYTNSVILSKLSQLVKNVHTVKLT